MKKKWKVVETTITPKRAAELLRKTTASRVVDERWVAKLAADMVAGKWRDCTTLCATPLILDDRGGVEDGQHRLHAVLKAGKSIRAMVAQRRD